MTWAIIEFLGGLVLAIATVNDVFDTVVVPGASRTSLRIAQRVVSVSLPLWRLVGRGRSVPTSFAPFVLVAAFVLWMLLMDLGFGLMVHAVRSDFQPAVRSFPDALYTAGSSLVTVGLSGVTATGAARILVLTAAFCGLAIMTMAVTYLLEVQNSIAQRDAGILKLTTTAGEPPSGLGLLERYAELDFEDHIPEVMRSGRDWCARVLQSHSSHPSLVYFRSKGTGSGWPASLGALMDLALAVEFLIDAPQWRGLAVLLREDGGRMAHTLIEMVGLHQETEATTLAEVEQLLARLGQAGYALRPDPDREAFCAHRTRYAGCVRSMAHHLGTAESPLLAAA